MKKRYESKTFPFSPEQLVKLSERVYYPGVRVVKNAYCMIREIYPEDDQNSWWIWVALAAYRAGRLSMWRDCREHQHNRRAAR
ncbi:hypothetical protein [Anaerotruncus rubiinfantis]|uniref:hypothetical protein n=1 Tax=Anaerotruncus rubiinfantis TaxID=1720200 RepID=UPI0034A4A0F8